MRASGYYWVRDAGRPTDRPRVVELCKSGNWFECGTDMEFDEDDFEVLGPVEPFEELTDEWPTTWPRYYNGEPYPCDMRVGPCCCGETHWDGEFTVKYNVAVGFPTLVRRTKPI